MKQCTEHLDCVTSIKIEKSECFHQCSGVLVTSFDQQDEQEDRSDIRFKKLVEYMSRSGDYFLDYFKDMAKVFQGSDKYIINLTLN